MEIPNKCSFEGVKSVVTIHFIEGYAGGRSLTFTRPSSNKVLDTAAAAAVGSLVSLPVAASVALELHPKT